MEPDWLDSAYSMGFAYEELGQWTEACKVWEGIADHQAERGFGMEANWPREQEGKCKEKMKK